MASTLVPVLLIVCWVRCHALVLPPDVSSLPIFPLRKRVRLPGETLTLNLYEDRYLRMSENILNQDKRLFGALFSANKPQLVSRGSGPIIPMIDIGDTGVVFEVLHSEEGMVPTRGGELRRRVRLEAVGVGRFTVDEILSDGTNIGDNLPYLLVRSSLRRTVIDNKERQTGSAIDEVGSFALASTQVSMDETTARQGLLEMDSLADRLALLDERSKKPT